MSEPTLAPGESVAALTQRAAAVRGTHSVIWISGSDATSFLDGLLSQSVAATGPDAVRRSLLLTPQGKMRALLWLLGGQSDKIGLVTQRSTAELVVADLTRFRFRVDAGIETDQRSVVALVGPGAPEALRAAGLDSPGTGWQTLPEGLIAAVPFTNSDLPRFVLVGEPADLVVDVVPEVGKEAYEAVRIAAGEPLGTVDFDDSTISQELGAVDDAVDFTKGCYLGQELVARIDSRGRVNRTLRAVVVPGHVALVGSMLASEDKEVGIVTSAASSMVTDETIGLALIRREVSDEAPVTAVAPDGELVGIVHALPLGWF